VKPQKSLPISPKTPKKTNLYSTTKNPKRKSYVNEKKKNLNDQKKLSFLSKTHKK